jgi:predicted lipoprotein with Yx(FWY)xxD motif
MSSLRFTRILLASAAIVALAACGSSGSSTASAQSPKTKTGAPATIGVTSTSLGTILVDTHDRTLYLFQKDTGTASTCTGACVASWPPLTAPTTPTSGNGAKASLIGTTKRQDGTSQLTYNGHPVYLFIGDQKPGDTNGQGISAFGARWFALDSGGNQVSGVASSGTSGTGNGY